MDELLTLLRQTLDLASDPRPDTPLLSSGLIDSFDVVGLIGVLEDRYGIEIDTGEIDAATFDTPEQILARIEEASRSKGPRPSPG